MAAAEWPRPAARPARDSESAYPTGRSSRSSRWPPAWSRAAKPSRIFNCGLDWNGLPGVTLHNWQPQGTLKLTEALTRSCNPAFYEIGLKLDRLDPLLLPTEARQFGLGQPTGVAGVHEVAGTVPDPAWKLQQQHEDWSSGDGVNLAIGQGYLLATPLQMANAYARLAAGGALRTPRLVGDQEGQTLGTLALTGRDPVIILDGMKRVTSTARGTAFYAFRTSDCRSRPRPARPKTKIRMRTPGSSGFSRPTAPTLLVLVMIEGGQHGGTVAAPVARTLIDLAFPLDR